MCGHSKHVTCVAISPCGELVLSGSVDRTFQMWDAVNGKPMSEPFRGHTEWINSVAFCEERGIIVSGSDDGTIRRWRTVPSTRISDSTQRCDGTVRRIMFSDGGQKLVICSTNGTLLQWDATKGKPIGKPMKGRLKKVVCFVANENFRMLLAVYEGAHKNYEVIRWNTSPCEMMCEPIVLPLARDLRSAAVSSNGEMIVTGSRDGTVQRWCTRSGDAIGEPMRGHKIWVKCVAFSGNDEVVVTGSFLGSIIRWSFANGEQIGKELLPKCIEWRYRHWF